MFKELLSAEIYFPFSDNAANQSTDLWQPPAGADDWDLGSFTTPVFSEESTGLSAEVLEGMTLLARINALRIRPLSPEAQAMVDDELKRSIQKSVAESAKKHGGFVKRLFRN